MPSIKPSIYKLIGILRAHTGTIGCIGLTQPNTVMEKQVTVGKAFDLNAERTLVLGLPQTLRNTVIAVVPVLAHRSS